MFFAKIKISWKKDEFAWVIRFLPEMLLTELNLLTWLVYFKTL